MTTKTLLTCLLMFAFLGLDAQIMDSFLRLIADPNVPSLTKAEVTSKLCGYYIANNRDSAEYYQEINMEYARESKDPFQIASSKLLVSTLYRDIWGLDSTEAYHQALLKDPFVQTNNEIKKTIYNDLGVLYGDNGDQETAIEYALIALEIARTLGDSIDIGRSVANLGVGYFNMSLNQPALEKYKEAASIFHNIDHASFEAFCYSGIVNVFDNIGEIDSAFYYAGILRSLADSVELTQYKANALISMGQILLTKERYEEAYEEFETAMSIYETVGDDLSVAYCNCNLGATKYYLGAYQDALAFYEKALSYDIYQDNHLATQACAKELAYTYHALGNPDMAYKYLKDYVLYQDTILLKENKEVIASIESKYNIAQKEAEIEKQKAEIDKKTYRQNLTAGGLLLSLLLGGSLIWGLMNRSKNNKKIASQADHLKSQKIQTLEQEKKLLSMSSMLEGQESERIRIAKDLHDGLGGLLTTVKAHFGKIQAEIENLENIDVYTSANLMIDKAYDEVRRISHNLMPADLRVGGLPVGIRQLVHELKNVHEIKTDFELVGFSDERVDEKIELSIYRITQELINNLLKYADASTVFIQLSKFKEEIQVTVEDNGRGFDYENALSSSGLGLKSILSRVQQMKGSMDVDSSAGNGTSVTINVPI